MVHFKKVITTAVNGTLVAEASELRLAPGSFPQTIVADWDGQTRTWDRYATDTQNGEVTGVRYRERGGFLTLLVIND